MGHNINKTNGKYNVFVVGQPAWHGLGKVLDKPATAKEAIEAAGLDFEVEKKQLYFSSVSAFKEPKKPTWQPVGNQYATVRMDTMQALGVVGEQYTILQNREAFSFFDAVVDEGQAVYTSAGVLGIGQRIWIAAKLPRQLHIGKDDGVDLYTIITNGHDGRVSLQAMTTPVRVVCQNTLDFAIGSGRQAYTIRHTSGLHDRVKDAYQYIGLISKEAGQLELFYQALTSVSMNADQIKTFIKNMLPATRRIGGADIISTNLKRKREKVLELIETAPGNDMATAKGTAWGVYNAWTHYLDYESPKGKVYLKSQFTGTRARARARAADFLKAIYLS